MLSVSNPTEPQVHPDLEASLLDPRGLDMLIAVSARGETGEYSW